MFILEAMAAGVPVVATAVGAVCEVVADCGSSSTRTTRRS